MRERWGMERTNRSAKAFKVGLGAGKKQRLHPTVAEQAGGTRP
jgi:hypothetical protein